MFSLEIFIRKQYSLLFSFSSCCCSNYFCLFSHDEMEPEVKFLKPYLRNPVIVFQESFWVKECDQNIKHKRRSSLSVNLGIGLEMIQGGAPLWFTMCTTISTIMIHTVLESVQDFERLLTFQRVLKYWEDLWWLVIARFPEKRGLQYIGIGNLKYRSPPAEWRWEFEDQTTTLLHNPRTTLAMVKMHFCPK